MTTTSRCARCGAPQTADDTSCTACLIRLGFEPEADPPAPATPSDFSAEVTTLVDPTGEGFLHRRLGEYELLEEIGRGGMGIVYRARQPRLDRLVAVKVLLVGRFASPESARRFEREARAAARLHHPHIVAIHEFGVADGQAFLSMDCVPGPSLAARIRDGPLPPDQAARYLAAIARAVDYAHTHGILHRDLKPANILLDADDQPQLTDFGLAKHLGEGPEVTLTGQALGSPNYMPPSPRPSAPAGPNASNANSVSRSSARAKSAANASANPTSSPVGASSRPGIPPGPSSGISKPSASTRTAPSRRPSTASASPPPDNSPRRSSAS